MSNSALILSFFIMIFANLFYNFYSNKKWKNELKNEKLISTFSWNRMDLMKMVELGEIDVHSEYFKFILTMNIKNDL